MGRLTFPAEGRACSGPRIGKSIISGALASKWEVECGENEEIGRQDPVGHGREDLK